MQAIARRELPNVEAGRSAIAASVSPPTYEPRNREAWDEAFARFSRLADAAH